MLAHKSKVAKARATIGVASWSLFFATRGRLLGNSRSFVLAWAPAHVGDDWTKSTGLIDARKPFLKNGELSTSEWNI
jgi:hypothetical protein